MVNGQISDGPSPARVELKTFTKGPGHTWHASLSGLGDQGDNASQPTRSLLALFEGDRLLGPMHSSHAAVADFGHGRYSHWGDTLYFSTSDASDPNLNGRSYVAVCPQRDV
jgi:hypothetical protein